MSSSAVEIYPSDVIKSVAIAIKKNPTDKRGYSAFRINFSDKYEAPNGRVTYYGFEINLYGKSWEKLRISVINFKHLGKIKPIIGDDSRSVLGYYDITFMFRSSTKFLRPNGLGKMVSEDFAKAFKFASDAFAFHAKKGQSLNKLDPDFKILPAYKESKKVKKDGIFVIEKFEDPPINVKIKFQKGTREEDRKLSHIGFMNKIFDAKKFRETNNGGLEFEEATIGSDNMKLNNGNIHEFIKGGSLISGKINLGQVVESQDKISLPTSMLGEIYVKVPENAGGQNKFSNPLLHLIAEAENIIEEEPTEVEYIDNKTPIAEDIGTVDEFDSLDSLGDDFDDLDI